MNALHLEVLSLYELVEGLQVYDWPLAPIFLWDQEKGVVEAIFWMVQNLCHHPFLLEIQDFCLDQKFLILTVVRGVWFGLLIGFLSEFYPITLYCV